MYPLSCANTRHGVRKFAVDGMIKDTKEIQNIEYLEKRA